MRINVVERRIAAFQPNSRYARMKVKRIIDRPSAGPKFWIYHLKARVLATI
ncbi:hypothetical protein [Mesorhizobium sp. WSM3859]|uniref:hypothetical protein n=1 Tax=Mesorhizobium sp. WSM3859 TaxID=2029402 RepID=UPI0015971404|nr:hypothetical protein [Mesorhizobium sp. WSM3859]